MGGDCLHHGCVPSKAFIHAAKSAASIRSAGSLGLHVDTMHIDFAELMERVQNVVSQVAPHDSVERYRHLGVDVMEGHARVINPWTVEIRQSNGTTHRLTTRSIVIAAGSEPAVPDITGLPEIGYLTSNTVWSLRQRPRHLVVLGGGAMGAELSQAFSRLECRVTQIETQPQLLPQEDPEVSTLVMERLGVDGVVIFCRTRVLRVERAGERKLLACERDGAMFFIEFDQLLVATGRVARIKGFGLEELGVVVDHRLSVNDVLQTNFPNIYGCGDVASDIQLTHLAGHMAWHATVNALFGKILWLRGGRFRVSYEAMPRAIFTDPEVARIGLNETEAIKRKVAHEITIYELPELDRAMIDGLRCGFVKILTKPGADRILGVTIVGRHAADLISEYGLAMHSRLGLKRIFSTIHIYPTLSEANKYAAGVWMRSHTPNRLLRWIGKYHDWQRREF